jgi:hypothetical protein
MIGRARAGCHARSDRCVHSLPGTTEAHLIELFGMVTD